MIDQDSIKKEFISWLENFVEVPNSKLGGWPPCPYARQARMTNKIELLFSKIENLHKDVHDSLQLLESKDVVVICFDHTTINGTDLQEFVATMNLELMERNYVILEDHPDVFEYINGVKMNFNLCGLLVISELNKLNDASLKIGANGYYDHWSKSNIDDVVSWRFR